MDQSQTNIKSIQKERVAKTPKNQRSTTTTTTNSNGKEEGKRSLEYSTPMNNKNENKQQEEINSMAMNKTTEKVLSPFHLHKENNKIKSVLGPKTRTPKSKRKNSGKKNKRIILNDDTSKELKSIKKEITKPEVKKYQKLHGASTPKKAETKITSAKKKSSKKRSKSTSKKRSNRKLSPIVNSQPYDANNNESVFPVNLEDKFHQESSPKDITNTMDVDSMNDNSNVSPPVLMTPAKKQPEAPLSHSSKRVKLNHNAHGSNRKQQQHNRNQRQASTTIRSPRPPNVSTLLYTSCICTIALSCIVFF